MILDREDDLGGTWHVNHYPGLAVDVPTTTYSYFFEPNPNWSRLFAPGPEIKQYADDVADKYDVRRHMRFNTVVEGARWDEDAERLAGRAGRRRDADRALPDHRDRLPVPAEGARHPGHRPSFAGKVIHTTAWDDDYPTRGPPGRGHRHRRHRRPAHPRTGQEGRRPHRLPAHPDLGGAQDRPAFRRAGQAAVRPGAVDAARHPLADRFDLRVHDQHRGDASPALPPAQHRRSGPVEDPPLRVDPRQGAAPQADAGLRLRLQAADVLQRLLPRVHQAARAPAGPTASTRIEADGIVTTDGTKTVIDTLVLATGFDLWEANFPAIEVIGRDGRNLGKWWRDTRFQAYQGVIDAVLPELPEPGQPVSRSSG